MLESRGDQFASIILNLVLTSIFAGKLRFFRINFAWDQVCPWIFIWVLVLCKHIDRNYNHLFSRLQCSLQCVIYFWFVCWSLHHIHIHRFGVWEFEPSARMQFGRRCRDMVHWWLKMTIDSHLSFILQWFHRFHSKRLLFRWQFPLELACQLNGGVPFWEKNTILVWRELEPEVHVNFSFFGKMFADDSK